MRRMERRMYRRRRGQAFVRRVVLTLLLAALATAALWHVHGRTSLKASPVADPTATPLTAAYDQALETREITLSQECWYAIQTGIFSSEDAAHNKAGVYADRGAPGYVTPDGEKWRVLIACYGDKDDASTVRMRLEQVQQVETYLYEWVCPQLRLRLSGMAGQLDVLEAGLTMMQQTAALLRDDAARLDSGELTSGEIRDIAAGMDEQASLWAKVAQERFARPYPAIIGELLAWTEQWKDCSSAVVSAAQAGPTDLSAEMKQQAMKLYERNIQFRNELNAQ